LAYDANGNTTTDENGNTYTWDALNRLVAIVYNSGPNSGTHTEFAYDGLSRRVQIVERAGTTVGSGTVASTKNYLWVGTEIAEERDASNVVTKRFFSQGEQQSGTNYYYTYDHLGSVREMCTSTGTITSRMAYDPYGRTTTVSGTVLPTKQYAGMYLHVASALYLTLAGDGDSTGRLYDASTGRWLNRDPIAEKGGLNLYEYVSDDPIRYVDILGLEISTDDAGRQCDCNLMQPVEEHDYNPLGIPHTFLVTPFGTFGHYPKKDGSPFGPGIVKNDHGHPSSRTRTYKACPKTVGLLRQSIYAHLNDRYDFTNLTSTNCTAWADARLADAGLTGVGWSWIPGTVENPWTHGW